MIQNVGTGLTIVTCRQDKLHHLDTFENLQLCYPTTKSVRNLDCIVLSNTLCLNFFKSKRLKSVYILGLSAGCSRSVSSVTGKHNAYEYNLMSLILWLPWGREGRVSLLILLVWGRGYCSIHSNKSIIFQIRCREQS